MASHKENCSASFRLCCVKVVLAFRFFLAWSFDLESFLLDPEACRLATGGTQRWNADIWRLKFDGDRCTCMQNRGIDIADAIINVEALKRIKCKVDNAFSIPIDE